MRKKLISILLTAAIAVGTLAGCGNSGQQAEAPKPSEESAVENEAAEETVKEDPVTVKWLMAGTEPEDFDMVMEDLNQKLVEKINVILDLEIIPGGEFADRAKLASTSGEDFDIVFTSNWQNSFDENMNREAFLPLNDLLEEYGQGILENCPDWLLEVSKVNGSYYAIPNMQIIAKNEGIVVQKEYADKYGLDIKEFETYKDFEWFLEELAKNEPNLFPMDRRFWYYIDAQYEEFANGTVEVNKETGEVVGWSDAAKEELKDRYDYLQKGYVRKDIATVTDTSADDKANRYVVSSTTYKPGVAASRTQSYGVEYIAIPEKASYISAMAGQETMNAININSKNPEAAVKLLNLLYTDKEVYNELLFGLEDVHYKKVGDNRVETISDTYYLAGDAWRYGNQFNAWLIPGQDDDTWEATETMNNTAVISPLRGFVFDASPVEAEIANVKAAKAEFNVYAAKDFDTWYAEMQEKVKLAGEDKIVEEFSKQLEAWKSAQ